VLDGTWKPFGPAQRIPRTGRIKCGTESNCGFKNITVSNVTMRNLVNSPIFMRLGSRLRGPQGTAVGKLRRVSISNLVVSNADRRCSSIISGIPGCAVEDERLNDIYFLSQGGGTKEDAALEPPEKASGYPEPTMFGTMPAYGFFIRHAKGMRVSNVELQYATPDARPPFVLQDVQGADFLHVKAQREPGVAVFVLKKTADFGVYLSRPVPDTYLESTEGTKLGGGPPGRLGDALKQ
jgi:polygalacturonase